MRGTKHISAGVVVVCVVDPPQTVSVEQLLFLTCREQKDETAILIVCLSEGYVQGWPMLIQGCCLGQFLAVTPDETLNAATVTPRNEYLICGDSLGYIKVSWF